MYRLLGLIYLVVYLYMHLQMLSPANVRVVAVKLMTIPGGFSMLPIIVFSPGEQFHPISTWLSIKVYSQALGPD